MKESFEAIEKRFHELESLLSQSEVFQNPSRYQAYSKELAAIRPIVEGLQELRRIEAEIRGVEHLVQEEGTSTELLRLYESEKVALVERKRVLEGKLADMIVARESGDQDRDIIVEIRAGTGGEEAALFVADLFRMYLKYANSLGFRVDVMNTHQTGLGGFKEVIFSVSPPQAYRAFKYESGTHRVQRVPVTEASGRIHTSAVTVAVLREPREVEVAIDPKDIRVDVFRSSGPGGQGVNTTDSAVRITHLPSGIVVSCQDERSQHKNKVKALRILRARLLDRVGREQSGAIREQRRMQIGSGDRSEKIRTFNFPDHRVTDHRIGLTLYNLDEILEGRLGPLVNALEQNQRAKILAEKKP